MRRKIISTLIVFSVTSAFILFERLILTPRLSQATSVPLFSQPLVPERIAALLAPEEIAVEVASPSVVIVKRSLEDPGVFSLTEPLLDTLVGPPKLEQLPELEYDLTRELFPKPDVIKPAVKFWKSIYAQYDSNQVVFHDKRYLGIVYTVLDFSELAEDEKLTDEEKTVFRREQVQQKFAELTAILDRLDAIQGQARPLGKGERKVWKLWSFLDDDPKRFAEARENLRTQTGLRDRFAEGLKIAGAYLPHMEDIFALYQLPVELTRMVFVESMFQNIALSKVGAAGLWQFMPSTGRLYLKINDWVDERLDPLIATQAAARVLRENYQKLGTWPLAINAYNTGAGRLLSAIKKLGTTDIGTIISRYDGNGYGFASRNFYPEFLASLEVYNNSRHIFGDLNVEDPIEYEIVRLPAKASFHHLAEILRLDLESLRDLNPAFRERAFGEAVYLPEGSTVRVPLGEGSRVVEGVYNLARKGAGDKKEVD